MNVPMTVLPLDGRPPIARGDAAEAAKSELRHAIYRNERSWIDRLVSRVASWFGGRTKDALHAVDGKPNGLVVILVVLALVALVALIVWRGGRVQRNVGRAEVLVLRRGVGGWQARVGAVGDRRRGHARRGGG